MSDVRFQVSCVIFFFFYKVVELDVRGSVVNGAYPCSFQKYVASNILPLLCLSCSATLPLVFPVCEVLYMSYMSYMFYMSYMSFMLQWDVPHVGRWLCHGSAEGGYTVVSGRGMLSLFWKCRLCSGHIVSVSDISSLSWLCRFCPGHVVSSWACRLCPGHVVSVMDMSSLFWTCCLCSGHVVSVLDISSLSWSCRLCLGHIVSVL